MKRLVLSKLEIVSLTDFEKECDKLFTKFFGLLEISELKNKPIQSAAGFYALKIALKNLYKSIYPKLTINEKDIILGHNSLGAPVIKGINADNSISFKNAVKISLSHTKINAYGLAVMEIDADE